MRLRLLFLLVLVLDPIRENVCQAYAISKSKGINPSQITLTTEQQQMLSALQTIVLQSITNNTAIANAFHTQMGAPVTIGNGQNNPGGIRQTVSGFLNNAYPPEISGAIRAVLSRPPFNNPFVQSLLAESTHPALDASWDVLDSFLSTVTTSNWDSLSREVQQMIPSQPTSVNRESLKPALAKLDMILSRHFDSVRKAKYPIGSLGNYANLLKTISDARIELSHVLEGSPQNTWQQAFSRIVTLPSISAHLATPIEIRDVSFLEMPKEKAAEENAAQENVSSDPVHDALLRTEGFVKKINSVVVIISAFLTVVGSAGTMLSVFSAARVTPTKADKCLTNNELARKICEFTWLPEVSMIVLEVVMLTSCFSILYTLHHSISVVNSQKNVSITANMNSMVMEEIKKMDEPDPKPKVQHKQAEVKPEATKDTTVTLLELESGIVEKDKGSTAVAAQSATQDIPEVPFVKLESTPEEQKKAFKEEILRELNRNNGKIDVSILRRVMHEVLRVKQDTIHEVMKKIDNPEHVLSVSQLRSELSRASVSAVGLLLQQSNFIFSATAVAFVAMILLVLTNSQLAMMVSIGVVLVLMMCCAIFNKMNGQNVQPTSEEVDSMFGEIQARKLLKFGSIVVAILVFAMLYYLMHRCKTPVVMCDNGSYPICASSGFPPKNQTCHDVVPDCSWSPGTYGSSVVICPTETIIGGVSDYGAFGRLTSIETAENTPSFNIGVTLGFDIDKTPETLLRNLKNPNTVYAYAEAGKFTILQNLLQTLSVTELPDDDEPTVITATAIVTSETECSATTIGHNFHNFKAKTTNRQLRNATIIDAFTPDLADQSNFKLCYLKDNQWKQVPNAWVVIAPLGGCSDPDCSASDFNSAFGDQFTDAIYYSLVVQSTIGFGDILPISARARMLTSTQALMLLLLDAI